MIKNNYYPGETSYNLPVVRFRTEIGEIIELEDKSYTDNDRVEPRFDEGAKIIVSYDEQNPKNFLILTKGRYS